MGDVLPEQRAVAGTEQARPLRIAFVVGGFHTESSGVARIVADLANALAAAGHDVTLYTAVCGDQQPPEGLLGDGVDLVAEPGLHAARLAWSPALNERLARDLRSADIVHNHSLWMLPNHYAAATARRHRLPLLYTTHGFLEPWALEHSGWKKRLASALFQRRDLASADCIQVNSRGEAERLRDQGFETPIAVVPNGVDLSPFDRVPPADALAGCLPEIRGKRTALFLSRLHAKKGIEELLTAWARLAAEFPGWHLVLAGPDDGAKASARRIVAESRLERSVTLPGPLRGDDKLAALAAAELFVLPSHSEGFSMALLEAAGAGLPALYTPGCNFPELAAAGGGRIAEAQPDALEAVLRLLLASPPDELAAMGRAGRELIARAYSWERAVASLVRVYRWLVGESSAPTDLLAA